MTEWDRIERYMGHDALVQLAGSDFCDERFAKCEDDVAVLVRVLEDGISLIACEPPAGS